MLILPLLSAGGHLIISQKAANLVSSWLTFCWEMCTLEQAYRAPRVSVCGDVTGVHGMEHMPPCAKRASASLVGVRYGKVRIPPMVPNRKNAFAFVAVCSIVALIALMASAG